MSKNCLLSVCLMLSACVLFVACTDDFVLPEDVTPSLHLRYICCVMGSTAFGRNMRMTRTVPTVPLSYVASRTWYNSSLPKHIP